MIRTSIPVAVLALTLTAACGSSSNDGGGTTGGASPQTAAQSAAPAVVLNPVDLIRQAGGDPQAGATVGSTDAQGNRVASGDIGPDDKGARESIRIYVWTGTPWPDQPSDDSTWHVRGTGFVVDLTGIIGPDGIEFPVPPETVAQKLGGIVVPRG